MKHMISLWLIASSLLLSLTVWAHDPALHKKEKAEKPQCEAMDNMDHSKMDINDPIMQAIMKQCVVNDHHDVNDDKKIQQRDKNTQQHERTKKIH